MSEYLRNEHIRAELALLVAALDEDDPTRCAVLEHAAHCPRCHALLAEGEALLELLDGYEHESPVDPRLKARVLASVAQVPQRRRSIRWEHLLLAQGAALSAWLAWFDGHHARVGLYPARGHFCVLWELLGVALAFGATALIQRKCLWRTPTRLALVAMSGALLGQLWLRARCPTHDAALHVLVFHVSAVILIALAGLASELWPWRSSA